jgi:hypothetical protein
VSLRTGREGLPVRCRNSPHLILLGSLNSSKCSATPSPPKRSVNAEERSRVCETPPGGNGAQRNRGRTGRGGPPVASRKSQPNFVRLLIAISKFSHGPRGGPTAYLRSRFLAQKRSAASLKEDRRHGNGQGRFAPCRAHTWEPAAVFPAHTPLPPCIVAFVRHERNRVTKQTGGPPPTEGGDMTLVDLRKLGATAPLRCEIRRPMIQEPG